MKKTKMHNPNQLLYITILENYWDDFHTAIEGQPNKILSEIKTNDISKLLTTKLISKITNKPNLYKYVVENISQKINQK